jgi:GntR family transcriptional regulator/MocR family aminotransferase
LCCRRRRRLELLAWARESGAWIVEDDYASEFRYGGRPLASLQGLDEAERIIHIGTLNKALFRDFGSAMPWCHIHSCPPSLPRAISWTASRRPFARRWSPPSWKRDTSQLTSAGMREIYRDQRDALVAAVRRRLGDHLSVDPPD